MRCLRVSQLMTRKASSPPLTAATSGSTQRLLSPMLHLPFQPTPLSTQQLLLPVLHPCFSPQQLLSPVLHPSVKSPGQSFQVNPLSRTLPGLTTLSGLSYVPTLSGLIPQWARCPCVFDNRLSILRLASACAARFSHRKATCPRPAFAHSTPRPVLESRAHNSSRERCSGFCNHNC